MDLTPNPSNAAPRSESAGNIGLGLFLMVTFGAGLAWRLGLFGLAPPLPMPFTLLSAAFFCFGLMMVTRGFTQLRRWERLTYGQGECRICSLFGVLVPLGFFALLAGLFGDIALTSLSGHINWVRAVTKNLPFLIAATFCAVTALFVAGLAVLSKLAPQRLEAWAAARRRQP